MIRVEVKGVPESIAIWGSKPVTAAMKSSLVRVSKTALSTASSVIREIYNIKKQDLDPRMSLTMQGDEAAILLFSGRGLSLSYFGARQFTTNKTITRGRKDGKATLATKTRKKTHVFQGVEVEVLKGKKIQLKSAFMAQMRSGHIGVMHRWSGKFMKGKPNRQAIGEKGVISVAYLIRKANVLPVVTAKIQEDWAKVFKQQMDYQLSKGKG